MTDLINNNLINEIKKILISSKAQVQISINSTMLQTYWHIGKTIVEEEQKR